MAYDAETSKIDKLATNGLAGVSNSLAYRVHELERHFHNWESWFGLAASPSGETNVADRIANAINPFQADAGVSDWGSWLQILGSSDTPARATMMKFDFHRIFVIATERTTRYYIQIGFGDSGAAALSAGTYTEFIMRPQSASVRSTPIDFLTRRYAAGTKVWFRTVCSGQSTGTIDFYVGMHEYEG